jgi:hypothetical protein
MSSIRPPASVTDPLGVEAQKTRAGPIDRHMVHAYRMMDQKKFGGKIAGRDEALNRRNANDVQKPDREDSRRRVRDQPQ